MARDWGRAWVIGTSLLITFISFSSQIFVVWPWYGRVISVDLLKLLVPFNFCVFMVFWNYRLCVITPPGGVPTGWRPNLSSMEGQEVKKGNHAPRYCKTCEHYKPPRAHHCRQCKTCILKLDHHCPWIANCVGFFNQGHFIRFLLWVDIATSYHLIMMVKRVFSMSYSYHEEPTLSDILFLVFNFASCAPVWLCVGMFSMYHLYLACGNSTTIEGWEKDKVATLVRRGKIKEIKYPYSIGLVKNVKSVLGPNPLLWLWPQPMRGDGLSFPVNPDAGGESASEQWADIVAPRRDLSGPPLVPTGYGSGDEVIRGSGSGSIGRAGSGNGEERVRLSRDPNVQFSWPPQDPTRLPNPRPIPNGTSPFIYGNEGFNPNLRPSNSQIRSRSGYSRTPPDHSHGQEGYSSTEEREYGSISSGSNSRSSSPEIYLSDYDDHNEGPLPSGKRLPRVRRGSEGWEVRPGPAGPAGSWADLEYGGDTELREQRRPWEDEGRYNYYVPGE